MRIIIIPPKKAASVKIQVEQAPKPGEKLGLIQKLLKKVGWGKGGS